MENIKLMVDANFAYHIHTYLKRNNKCIDWKSFLDFIKVYVKDTFNTNGIQLALDAKYFTSTKTRTDDAERDFFYNSLDHANISKKATKLKLDGEFGLKEDAVDVLLAVTAMSDYYRARDEDKYSFFFLFAGDSDFVPLISELKSLGIKTIVVYLDCEYLCNPNNPSSKSRTFAGQALLTDADAIINLQDLLSERVNEVRKNVFKEYPKRFRHTLPRSNTESLSHVSENGSEDNSDISWNSIFSAMDACRHFQYGFVLAADLGVKLKENLGLTVLPKPLKEILEDYADKLDFEENPFRVRLKREIYLAR